MQRFLIEWLREQPDFEAEKIENITLSAAQVLALNFALKVAGQTQSVEVTSQEPLLNPRHA